MNRDSAGLDVLSQRECIDLLSWTPIGRIVFTDRALPAVQPVTFCLDGEDIVIRTGAGSKLAAATRDAVVAFEADDFDPGANTGWSVTAIGRARAVTAPAEITRLSALPLRIWTQRNQDHFIVLRAEQLSGRRIRCR
jgi:nitroimidazol reductase NimA-like FMN-containing flavoprotein (pyridoxamine 5'-phosphate oxidase superfamily)